MKSLYLPEWRTFIRYHELSGKGTTLLYLPGLSCPSVEQFLSVVMHDDMAAYRSLLVDYIGSGFSDDCQDFDYSIENHARCMAAVLDHEGIKGCVVIGHSIGGTVGIKLAIVRPDLVSALIVAEANISPGGGEATKRITSYSEEKYVNEAHRAYLDKAKEAEKEGQPLAAFISGAWSRAQPCGLHRSSVALVELEESLKHEFQQLSIPRTFVYGEDSFSRDPSKAQPDAPDPKELERFGVQIAVVPNAGHMMMFDNPRGFVDVLNTTLGEVDQRRSTAQDKPNRRQKRTNPGRT